LTCQFRLFLHAGAYWLLWSMRRVMPKHSVWRVMQFDTLRLRLVKLAARGAQGKLRAFHRRTPASKWWSALSQQEKDKLFDQFLRWASERPELQQRLEPQ
jgi:hypothetical protein